MVIEETQDGTMTNEYAVPDNWEPPLHGLADTWVGRGEWFSPKED